MRTKNLDEEKTVNDADNDEEDILSLHDNVEDEDAASGTVTPAAPEGVAMAQPKTEESNNPTLDGDAAEFAANGPKEDASGGKKKGKNKKGDEH